MTDKQILMQMFDKIRIDFKISGNINKITLEIAEHVIFTFDELDNLKDIDINY